MFTFHQQSLSYVGTGLPGGGSLANLLSRIVVFNPYPAKKICFENAVCFLRLLHFSIQVNASPGQTSTIQVHNVCNIGYL